jgi:hypothetical protein
LKRPLTLARLAEDEEPGRASGEARGAGKEGLPARSMIVERVRAGVARAKASGK